MAELRRPLRELLREPVDERRVERMWQGISARRQQRTTTVRAAMPALAGALCLLAVVVAVRGPEGKAPTGPVARPEAPRSQALRLADGAPLAVVEVDSHAGAARDITLTDGTRISVSAGSRLSALASTPERVEFEVDKGQARFEVQPQGTRRFEVVAGALRVRVVGTAFSVERSPDAMSVSVEHGRVRVHTPDGEHMLGAGESLHWPPSSAAPSAQPSPAAIEPNVAATTSAPIPVDALAMSDPRIRAALDRGDFARAYGLLGKSGFTRALSQAGSLDALLQLADMARAAKRPADAVRALTRLTERHAHDDRAALAALTLGRLQLDALARPAAAERALRLALSLGLPAALEEDALARLVEACAKSGDAKQTKTAAERYHTRFPNGRWRASVAQWSLSQ